MNISEFKCQEEYASAIHVSSLIDPLTVLIGPSIRPLQLPRSTMLSGRAVRCLSIYMFVFILSGQCQGHLKVKVKAINACTYNVS